MLLVEAEVAGFGASGRNGGWCSAAPAGLRRRAGPPARARRRPGDARRDAGHRRRGGRGAPPRSRSTAGSRSAAPSRVARNRAAAGARGRRRRRRRPVGRRVAPARRRRRRPSTSRAAGVGRRLVHARLRPGPPRPAGPRAAGRRAVARRPAGRGDARPAPLAPRGRHRPRHRARAAGWSARPRRGARTCPGRAATSPRCYSHMIATEPLPPRGLGADRAGPRADVHRRAPPHRLRPAHHRRPSRVRRPRGARTTWARPSGRRTTRSTPPPRTCGTRWSTCSRCSTGPRSPTTGAVRSACRATGTRRSGSTPRPGSRWAGGYVGDGVALDQPRGPDARRPDHGCGQRRSCTCRGSATAPPPGSRSRCAGRASRRPGGRPRGRTAPRRGPVTRAALGGLLSQVLGPLSRQARARISCARVRAQTSAARTASSVRSSGAVPSCSPSTRSTVADDVEEPDPAGEERRDALLVGGVVDRRVRSRTPRRASRASRTAANTSSSSGSNVHAVAVRPVARRRDVRHPVRPRQPERDRQPHVRRRRLRDRGAVDELDHRVHHRLRVHHHGDVVDGHVEQQVRLDQLEALVHQRRGVDRHDGAHRPRRVRERLLRGDGLDVVVATSRGTGRPTP